MDVGSKPWWRRELRRRARTVEPWSSAAVGRSVAAFLGEGDGLVLAYRALPGEVDLDAVIDAAPQRFALTRTPDGDGPLTLHPATAPPERHRFGFDQPVADAPVVPDDEISVALVPGLAFDAAGGRLGRGQGHYDRLLPRLSCPVVGVTTLATVVDALPTEDHDVPMTHLATEAGVDAVRSTRP